MNQYNTNLPTNEELLSSSKFYQIAVNPNIDDIGIQALLNMHLMGVRSHSLATFNAKKQLGYTGDKQIGTLEEFAKIETEKGKSNFEFQSILELRVKRLNTYLNETLKLGNQHYGLNLAIIIRNGFLIYNVIDLIELEPEARSLIQNHLKQNQTAIETCTQKLKDILTDSGLDFTNTNLYDINYIYGVNEARDFKKIIINVAQAYNVDNEDDPYTLEEIDTLTSIVVPKIFELKSLLNNFVSTKISDLVSLFDGTKYAITNHLWKALSKKYTRNINYIFGVNEENYIPDIFKRSN